MEQPKPDLAAEFAAMMARAGLTVSAAQRDRVLPGYGELREMLELLRGRPHTLEPSNVFRIPHSTQGAAERPTVEPSPPSGAR